MTRRIAAGILTLLLLMNLVLPAGAADTTDTTVYPIGYKDMWVVGLETVPTAKTEYPGQWQPVYKADGVTRESKPGSCPLHACGTGCYDVVGNKTCGVAPEDEHQHNIKCAIEATIKYATYQWQVVDPTANDDEEGTEPQETQPTGTEPPEEEYNDGSASFYIYNAGADEVPLERVEFLLLEVKTEQDPNDPDKTITNEYVKANAWTDEKGIAFLKGLRLTGDATEATWKLIQNPLEGDLAKIYQSNATEWEVTIVRNADDTHTITDVKPAGFESTANPGGAQTEYELYNKETRTLTVVNELLQGTIVIDVFFEGFGDTIPEGVNATVTVTDPDGKTTALEFPTTQTRYMQQQALLQELKMGTYNITATDPVAVEGYTAEGPIVQLQFPVEAGPVPEDSVTLRWDNYNAKFTITYRYTVSCNHVYTETVVSPTCTNNGYTLFACECGDSYTEEGDLATGHSYEPVVTDPTCTDIGYTTYTCINRNCGHSYREDGEPAIGHNYDVTDVAPTCTEKGYTAYTCLNENCGHSYREEKADAIGHNCVAEDPVPPTCTEKGYTNHRCTNEGCDYSYQDAEVDAIGHKYEDTVVPPTCTEKGYTEHVCVNEGCEYSYQDTEVNETGHKYEDTVVPPTCTEKGYTTHTCINGNCDFSYQDTEVAATDHSYKEEIVPPTCTEKGYTTYTCTNENCGHSYKDNEVDAIGHKYKDTVVPPTCTEKGYTDHICVNEGCKYSYQDAEVNETGHDYVPSPTTDGEGYIHHICSKCGDIREEKPQDPTQKPTETEPTTEGMPGTGTVKQSNIIIVRAVDDLGNPLENTEIGLFNEKKAIKTWRATYDNVFVLDDLEKLVGDGESASYTLKQTKAQAGHHLAAETYTVTINKKNGDTRVDVKKNAGSLGDMFKGSGVEMGTDGKQIVTFVNERKTTLIELKCETIVDFAKGSWEDETLIEECREKPYQFILTWEDAEGDRQEETVTVTDEDSVVLEAEIPYGTDYELTALDEDGSYVITLSENCEGTVDAEQVRGNIEIHVTRVYTVEPGSTLMLNLTKVDADTKRPIPGVEFSLKNDKGIELGTYTSDGNGEFIVKDVFTKPGSYALGETKTVEGYQLLPTPVRIEVSVQYTLDNSASAPVLVQTMTAAIVSNAVVEESDGSFWIENGLIQEEPEEKSGGMGIGAVIGIGLAGAAGLAGLSVVLIRRKRRGK